MITAAQIEVHQRKLALIEALSAEFDKRIVQVSRAKNCDAGHLLKAQAMKDTFMRTARSQPDSVFADLTDVNAALIAIKPLVKI